MDYEAKSKKKKRNFGKISLPTTFPKYIHANFLSIENADKEQSNLFKELCEMSKGEKLLEKLPFIENVILLLDAREKVLIVSRVIYFQLKIQRLIQYPVQHLIHQYFIYLNKQFRYLKSKYLHLNLMKIFLVKLEMMKKT